MTVTLSAEHDRFLEAEVAAGRFTSVSEAVHEAIERLRAARETEAVRRSIVECKASLERGEGATIRTEAELRQFFAGIEERGQARLEAERQRA